MPAPGITLLAYEPLSEQGLYARDFLDDLTDRQDGYKHVIKAVGGYDVADFKLEGDRTFLEEWFADGLMRRVLLLNPEGLISWEGYVNRLTLTVGSLERTKTIENMYNRVYLRFTPVDTSTDPPTPSEVQTLIFDKLDSQARWGIKSFIIKGGELTHLEAYDWARTVLQVHGDVTEGENVVTTSNKDPILKVELKGYYHTLEWLPYLSSTTGNILAHQVIQEVLTYFNNINQGWLSTDFGRLDYSFRLERRGSDELKTCWDVIEGIINRGGSGGERWVGGMYQERQFDYKPAEDFQILYGEQSLLVRELGDISQRIFEEDTMMEIKPWDMLPDRILRTTDL